MKKKNQFFFYLKIFSFWRWTFLYLNRLVFIMRIRFFLYFRRQYLNARKVRWNNLSILHYSESQCGFRKDRGTLDMKFTARQLQEKCQEQNIDLYMTFVDLTKAFDTVSREDLWKIMAKFGCPTKFIAMVRQFHDDMLARVQNDSTLSDPFPVTNGVKQGYVLAPALFSMMFSAMLTAAFQDADNGIPIRYRFDGKLFKLRRLQAKSKVQTEVLDEFLCWWHSKGCSNRREDAKRCRSSIWFLWQLWPHNQHQKDRGCLSTSTWQALQGAHHYSERSKIASARQSHLPWKHIVKSRAHWRWSQLVQHLADYVVVFAIEVESGLTQSWKSTKLWCCHHYCMHAKRGQFTNGKPKDWTTDIQAALENF